MTIPAEVLARYVEEADKVVSETIPMLDGPGWHEEKKEPEIVFYKRTSPTSSFAQVKSVVSIPGSMDEVLAALRPISVIDETTPRDQRHGIVERRVVFGPQDDESETCVFYIALEPPRFVTSRDFVLFRRLVKLDGGKMCYFHHSVECDLVPVDKKKVRANMFFQGFLCEQDPSDANAIQLTFFAQADPMGSIPAMAYNMTAINQGYTAKGIKKRVMMSK